MFKKAVEGKFYIDSHQPNTVYRVDCVMMINKEWCVERTLYDLNGNETGRETHGDLMKRPKSLIDCMDDDLAEKFKPKKK